MALELIADLEIRTLRTAGGLETHVTLGGSPLQLTRRLLDAVTALASGRQISAEAAELLLAAGVVVDHSAALAEQQVWDPLGSHVAGKPHPLSWRDCERVVLAPDVVLGCEQAPRYLRGQSVLPASSLPVSIFIEPEKLGPLQDLAAQVRGCWLQLVRTAQARGTIVDRDVACAMMTEQVTTEVAGNATLAEAVRVGEDGRLVPISPLQDVAIYYPLTALTLARGRGGDSPGFATGEYVIAVPMVDITAIGQCGRLLGLLNAGLGPDAIAAYLEEAPLARGLFGRLVALGLLAAAPKRVTMTGQLEPGTIAHLGHAALVANLGGAHIVVDPWLVASAAGDAPPPPGVADLPALDAIFLTHHHWDHLHVETLLQLDKRVPVYVPAQDRARILRPRLVEFLAYLGFADVRELQPGDEVELGTGGRVVAASFHGEDPTGIGFSGLAYVLVNGDQAALVNADSGRDIDGVSLVSTGEAKRLRDRFGKLSPLFTCRRQELVSMADSSWEFLLSPAAQWPQPRENCHNDAEFLAELGAAVGASCVALYAEGTRWYPGHIISRRERNRAAVYRYLWDSLETIREVAARAGAELIEAQPYQRFRIGGGRDGEIKGRRNFGDYD